VARPQERKFLGFSFTAGPEVKRAIAPKALDRFKQRIREITRRAKGVSMETTMEELAPYMGRWRSYFGRNARGADRLNSPCLKNTFP
jgi:RNA-directed DNA polymerase